MAAEAPACRDCQAPIAFAKLPNGRFKPTNPDGSDHNCPNRQNRAASNVRSFGRSAAELHDIRREAVLNAAVAFASAKLEAGTDIGAAQVIQVAHAFLAFVEEDRPE
jgi:hypothetical protein